jgi:protein-S-isoprenylcysteine O-methyltransferase Ste14
MAKKMTHFGVGPVVFGSGIVYDLLAGSATHLWPDIFLIRAIPVGILAGAGIVLLILGVPMWAMGVWTIVHAFRRGELVTSGVFGLVRHPIYSAWIVFIFPGIALLCRSWLMFGASVVSYAILKLLIWREDQYLEETFGQAYLDYRAKVNEIVPCSKLSKIFYIQHKKRSKRRKEN